MTAEEKAALEKQLSERAAKVSELESKLDTAEAKQRATDADLKVERERGVALRAQNEALVKERDTLKVRAETAETGLIARDVDAIVGKKITPAERDWAIKLRTADKGLFDEMVAQRSDLNLTNPLLPPAPNTGAGEQRAAARSDESGELFDELANQKGG